MLSGANLDGVYKFASQTQLMMDDHLLLMKSK